MSQNVPRYYIENYSKEKIAIKDRSLPAGDRIVAHAQDSETAEKIVEALNASVP